MFRIAAIGDLATHTRPQLECSAVTKFGIEFSLDNIQYVSEIATVIRRIASPIFDQARPQLADGEGAPGGLSRLAEMESMWRPSIRTFLSRGEHPFRAEAMFPSPITRSWIRSSCRRLSRLRGVELPFALFNAASPLVPGEGGADMVWASAFACGGDLLLRLAGCQGKDLIVEGQRATLAASRFCNPSAPALTRWRCSGCLR